MIALLMKCGSNYCQNNIAQTSSTGGLATDSVLVSYDDLRKANAKMIELKYEKEINEKLTKVVKNDSIVIESQTNYINDLLYKNVRLKKQRNILLGTTGGAIIVGILGIIIAK